MITFYTKELWKKLSDKDCLGFGRYLTKEGKIYIAIDNSTGHWWVEEFKSFDKAVAWLLGDIELC